MVMETTRLMKKPPVVDSLSDRVLEHASGLDIVEIGTCGSEKFREKYCKGFREIWNLSVEEWT